jgi:hypothetical protein
VIQALSLGVIESAQELDQLATAAERLSLSAASEQGAPAPGVDRKSGQRRAPSTDGRAVNTMSKRKIVTIVAVLALVGGGVFLLHPDPGCSRDPDPEPESTQGP